jgi:hypothetical protein
MLRIAQIFDIFINLNTAYYDKGLIVYDRIKILKHYYYTNFPSDMMYLSIKIYFNFIIKNILVILFYF